MPNVSRSCHNCFRLEPDGPCAARPRISEVVQDTKVLLQQSRERLVISRTTNDLSSYDTSKYNVAIIPSADGTLRFHLGEPIRVKWRAPVHHSRKDWIGIYRVGANQSSLVTKTSSLGMWVPVHDGEYDGDIPVELQPPKPTERDSPNSEEGEIVFTGNVLPWRTGTYEVRYHHNGKYNVMGLDGPFEISGTSYLSSPIPSPDRRCSFAFSCTYP